MKILGLGVPEMLIMLMLLVPVALVVALIVVLAKRAGSQQPLPDERQRASALATSVFRSLTTCINAAPSPKKSTR
mgnify:CR=1 FL=1